MYLIIAEKPSVARTLGGALGVYQEKEGYLEGKDYVISWCLGHLAEYDPPEGYGEQYKNWSFQDLPIIPVNWKLSIAKDKGSQFQSVKKLMHRDDIDYVVNACDVG